MALQAERRVEGLGLLSWSTLFLAEARMVAKTSGLVALAASRQAVLSVVKPTPIPVLGAMGTQQVAAGFANLIAG